MENKNSNLVAAVAAAAVAASAAAAAAEFHEPDSSEGLTAEEPPHFIRALTPSARWAAAWAHVKVAGAIRPQPEDCPSVLCKCRGEIGSSAQRTWRRPARLDFAGSAATGSDTRGRGERQG